MQNDSASKSSSSTCIEAVRAFFHDPSTTVSAQLPTIEIPSKQKLHQGMPANPIKAESELMSTDFK
jgi:hypothetical protein